MNFKYANFMNSTLAERLREAMNGPPKVSGKQVAKACNIKPPSVSGWLSGKSKTMEASNCLAVAKLLNVDPDWLASGVGLKRRQAGELDSYRHERISHALMVMERMAKYELDKVVKIIDMLAEPDKNGAAD